MRNLRVLIGALIVAAGCTDSGGVIGVDSTGVVSGLAYIDRNADGRLSLASDVVAAGVRAALLLDATGDTVARATSGTDGTFRMDQVPVGRYRLVADRGTLGDTVQVLAIDSAQFSVAAGDTVTRLVPLGYPTVNSASARALPAGRKVMLHGVALNGWATFGDSTVHVGDGSGAIRVVRVAPATVQAGDSIRIFGTTGTRDGHPVIADAALQVLSASVGLPAADSISTAAAADASGGMRADGQARIAAAVVLDTATVAGDLVLGVSDGSGRLEVVLDRQIAFTGSFVPGATFAGAGVLVPMASGSWRLKPRLPSEAVITFPTVSVSAARALETGRRISVEGIALNGSAAFADSTVHVRDATGAIRGVRVTGSVLAGDSIRLLGTVSVRDGQPVITNATATRLVGAIGLPPIDSIATGIAAGAQGGARDADQVRVGGQITGTNNEANGDLLLTVNDGSGTLEVVLDRDIAFNPGPYQAGAVLRVSGVLVPTGAGSWRLKPRSRDDAAASYPLVTVAAARTLQVGATVQLRGTALNSRNAFADATVHMEDATGSIRLTGMPPSPTVLAGYTIRVTGTVAVQNGQPVLQVSAISEVAVGSLPSPDSVSTSVAASAAGGSRDAGQVAISGAVTATSANAGGDFVVTVNDGTGALNVVLDRDIFQANPYVVGASIRARGVLVPVAGGAVWDLKPRTLAEVAQN